MKKCIVMILALSLGCAPAMLGGCAPRMGQADYDSSSARTVHKVEYGTVKSYRVVHIEDDSHVAEAVGTVGGGVAGGVLGSLIGGGSGRVVATVAGAAIGAAAGYGGAKALTGQDGLELTLAMDDGREIVITQGTDMQFHQGQRVKVITGGGESRVTHL